MQNERMMKRCKSYQINAGGQLLDLSVPCVMQIVNCTPDSFYAGEAGLRDDDSGLWTLDSGLSSIIDIGAYSTRPGHEEVSVEEEMRRLREFFKNENFITSQPHSLITSIDTFRADVAKMCVEEYGVQIVNDVSGGTDEEMFRTVARLGVPYVLTGVTSLRSTVNGQRSTAEFVSSLSRKVQMLRDMGQNDIIIDPGFGFGAGMDDDYYKLAHLEDYQVLDLPILVGISRKSMIQKVLGCNADEALNGTTALHMTALMKGANILRVHDAKEANETIKLYNKLCCLDSE